MKILTDPGRQMPATHLPLPSFLFFSQELRSKALNIHGSQFFLELINEIP